MYLLTQKQISSALSNAVAAGGGIACGAGGSDKYVEVQGHVKTRMEEAMEIRSLDRASFTDHFFIPADGAHTLRLEGGFLFESDTNLVILDSAGATVDKAAVGVEVDEELGLIYLGGIVAGRYSVTYVQGFETNDDKLYVGTPDWLQSIAIYCVVHHYRLTSSASSIPENVSYGDIHPATIREIFTRCTKRYCKPRAMTVFPTRTVRNG